MVAPSSISTRRFPDPVRVEIQVIYARAWEALTATHEAQAVAFVRHLRGRLGSDEALHRYFREVAVPMQMQETVRARALLALTPEERCHQSPDLVEPGSGRAPYRVIEALRRRAQYVEETSLACRLAASVADEAVSLNHVALALEVADTLRNVLPVDEALMHYIRAFELTSVPAQLVFQRALARIAELQPVMEYESMPAPVEAAPRISRPLPRPEPGFGLRAMV
jgi:hypothetical protein